MVLFNPLVKFTLHLCSFMQNLFHTTSNYTECQALMIIPSFSTPLTNKHTNKLLLLEAKIAASMVAKKLLPKKKK